MVWNELEFWLISDGWRCFSSCDTARDLLRNGGGVSMLSNMLLPGIDISADLRFEKDTGSSEDLLLFECVYWLERSKDISSEELLDSSSSEWLSSLISSSKLSAHLTIKCIVKTFCNLQVLELPTINSPLHLCNTRETKVARMQSRANCCSSTCPIPY